MKKSVLDQRVKSLKHQRCKERIQLNAKREQDLAKSLKEYDAKHHPSGEALPESTHPYCIKALETFLKAGVPLQKIDAFGDVLESHGFSLSDSCNLRKVIPFILESEISQLKESIAGKQVSVEGLRTRVG